MVFVRRRKMLELLELAKAEHVQAVAGLEAQLVAVEAELRALREPETKLVRLHLRDDPRSVEGVLIGEKAGHYVLAKAKILMDSNREHDIPVDGEDWWLRERVLHVQVIG